MDKNNREETFSGSGINWYPGHMTKARRAMQEDVKLIDLLIEIVDARVPISSRNPDIDELGRGKARLLILNKSDLAEEAATSRWEQRFAADGYGIVRADSRNSAQLKQVGQAVREVCREKIERDRKRGIIGRPIRAMVVGIPNVGKSTFINSFAGKSCAKTGNRPGVTRGNQWIRINKQVELLDTPGLLWPKLGDRQTGVHLAMIGSINDQILDLQELSAELIRFFNERYPGILEKRYGAEAEGEKALERIAAARSCLVKGGVYDLEKAAALFLDDFRSGRLGRITLEFPPD